MRVRLWEGLALPDTGRENEGCPELSVYLAEGDGPRGAVIVCPGGGYARRADHEGEPVAKWLNDLGLSAFVLHYRVAPNRHPLPLRDAQRAIRTARHRSAEWGIDPNRIGILGFSAGGHLASTAGTHYDAGDSNAPDPIERVGCRPDFMVLGYPVVTLQDPYAHQGSRANLLGEQPDPEQVEALSNELQVTEDTPPAFIWHTADDGSVPVENALAFSEALSRNKVPHELHVFASGRHGLGLAEGHPGASAWPTLCAEWLKGRGML